MFYLIFYCALTYESFLLFACFVRESLRHISANDELVLLYLLVLEDIQEHTVCHIHADISKFENLKFD